MGRKVNSDKASLRTKEQLSTYTAKCTAQRFEGKPLKQPSYIMADVPFCCKDLAGSCIQEVSDRQVFTDAIAEMLLLCKEAARRKLNNSNTTTNGTTKICTKPLSLEYIADRIDVDDPLFGFLVRTAKPNSAGDVYNGTRLMEGMLQGFITITTFTTWQKSFRWDSLHEASFSMDEPELASQVINGERLYDADGSLAAELEATVRCGDPWNEGIVWPHIAEISLLGGLGCGKTLLSLAIERLERMPPSASRHYDFVVVHATHNAVDFYESMGFVRVGAITQEAVMEDVSSQSVQQAEIVSSPVITYFTKKSGETLLDVSKTFDVNVWDIIFLNYCLYPSLEPKSLLIKGTKLFIPKKDTRGSDDADIQWYISKENETPKSIALKLKVPCQDLLDVNRTRLPDLCASSRLMKGTKIQVSHFHIRHERCVPFCHWTFPDESSVDVPSYMMIRKLHRSARTQSKKGPIESHLSIPVAKYDLTKTSETCVNDTTHSEKTSVKSSNRKRKYEGTAETPPKKPLTAFFLFMKDEKKKIQADSFNEMTDFSRNAAAKWKTLPAAVKAKYDAEYEEEKSKYQSALSLFQSKQKPSDRKACSQNAAMDNDNIRASTPLKRKEGPSPVNLFNKIVKLKKEGLHFINPEFEYYYVLTYIPDLFWCHLAPLQTVGFFGPNKSTAEGRPIWMLVSEEEGKEIDISAQYCDVVKARAMKGGTDADKEQWDIYSAATPALIGSVHMETVVQNDVLVSSERKAQHRKKPDVARRVPENLIDMTDHVINGHGGDKFTSETRTVNSAVNLAGFSAVLARRAAMKAQHLLS